MNRVLIIITLCVTGCLPSKSPYSMVDNKKIKSSYVTIYDWSKYYEITDITITPATNSDTITFSSLGCEFTLDFKIKFINDRLDNKHSALEFQEVQIVSKKNFTSADDFDKQIANDTIFVIPKLKEVKLEKAKPKNNISIQTTFNHFGSARHSNLTIVFQKNTYHYNTHWIKI